VGGDVYPSVDSTVHLPGRGPLHNHIRRHPSQDAGCECRPTQILHQLCPRVQFPCRAFAGVPGAGDQQAGPDRQDFILCGRVSALPYPRHASTHRVRHQRREPVLVRVAEAALPVPVLGVPLPSAIRQRLLQFVQQQQQQQQ